jgi:hypothetical protein
MKPAQIESILEENLSVNSERHIRGKNNVINKIGALHWTEMHTALMDIRLFIAKLSLGSNQKENLKSIDDFIYKKQIS